MRLVRSKRFNRTNTFAYVEFSSPASVSQALSLDRSSFMEKHMYVSPFKDKGEQPAAASKVKRGEFGKGSSACIHWRDLALLMMFSDLRG